MATLISILATYCITLLLTERDGPLGILYRLRKRLTALKCFACTSIYVAAPIALLATNNLRDWFIYTFGLAGGAILLHKIGENYGT